MEITIKIDCNEENMKKLADIFWAPIMAKIREENKTTEEVAPVDVEPKVVEPEDDFANKYKYLEKPTQNAVKKPEPTKPIKEWSEFSTMFDQRIKDSPLSIAEIANKLRVSQACRYNWKSGRRIPCPPYLGRLCYLFNWDLDYMLKLREEVVSK